MNAVTGKHSIQKFQPKVYNAKSRNRLPLSIRFIVRFSEPLHLTLALPARAWPDLLLSLFRSPLSGPRPHRNTRHSSRRRLSAGGTYPGRSALLVCTYPSLVLQQRPYVDGSLLGRSRRLFGSRRQYLAPRHAACLLSLLPLVR